MKTEKVIFGLLLIGLLFLIKGWEGGQLLPAITLQALAIICFPFGFYFFCDKKIKNQNLAWSIIGGFFLQLTPYGMYMKITGMDQGGAVLFISVVITPLVFIFTLYQKKSAATELTTYYNNMLIRSGIYSLLSMAFYYL